MLGINPASGYFLKHEEVWGPEEEAGLPGGHLGGLGQWHYPTRPPPITRMQIFQRFVKFEPSALLSPFFR